MKKYLADILTLARFVLAAILLVLAFTTIGTPGVALWLFAIGELTDAFDGTCAKKWPFPKNKTPKYRKYAAKFDMITDLYLGVAMGLFFILRMNLVLGLVLGITYGVISIIIDFVIYGKIMGHPDDAKKNSLMNKNFNLAKRIILMRRMVYVGLLAFAVFYTLYFSEYGLVAKIIITIIAVAIGIFLWFFQSQRRHNISRDAVDIEEKLSKTAK